MSEDGVCESAGRTFALGTGDVNDIEGIEVLRLGQKA